MTPETETKRRPVRYTSLAGFRSDAEKLAAGMYVTTGKWTYGQILAHLAATIHASFDGFAIRLKWYQRLAVLVLAPFWKHSVLTQTMKAGYRLPASAGALRPPDDISTEQALTELQRALDRFERETPEAAHPIFGRLTLDEWVSLHLRHAELHMSFVHPA